MRKRHLPKIAFTICFLLTAGLSVGFILGYRININDRVIEKRSVLALQGSGVIELTIDDQLPKKVQLPYVNTNLTLGTHDITLRIPRHHDAEFTILAKEDQATIVPAILAPNLSILPNVRFVSTVTERLFPLDTLLFVFNTDKKSLEMYDDIEHYLIKSPSITSIIGIFPNEIAHITTDQFLIKSTVGSYLFSSKTGDLRTLPDMLGRRRYFTCLGSLCSWVDNTLYHHNLVTLKADVLALDVVSYFTADDQELHTISSDGKKAILTMGLLGAVDKVDIAQTIQQKYSNLLRTSSGLVLSEDTAIAKDIQHIYTQSSFIYMANSIGQLFSFEQEELVPLLQLSEPVIALKILTQGRVLLQTQHTLYLCHESDFDYCHLMYTSLGDIQHIGIDPDNSFLTIEELDSDTITYSVYALPLD